MKQQKHDKISSFFGLKSPEPPKEDVGDDMIENSPEVAVSAEEGGISKKRKLFKLKKNCSKARDLFAASTTSLIAGNLNRQATKVHSPPPPLPKYEETKKRPLAPNKMFSITKIYQYF